MKTPRSLTLSSLLWAWAYGLVCGLGIAATAIGLLRGEALPGVLWPALTPLLLSPLLILRLVGRGEKSIS
jgi:hypothetical protein